MKPCAPLLTQLLLLLHPAPAHTQLSMRNSSFNTLRGLQQFQQFLSSPFSSSATISPNMTRLAPVVSISHGGGPMPLLGDPSQAAIAKSLKTKVPAILKIGTAEQPRAIVLVTAHWSTNVPTISSAEKHELLYDYYGFPPEAYELKYDAPGSPEVAELVGGALEAKGLSPRKDLSRGMIYHP